MIIGIDPSLTCTGISDGKRSEVIKTTPGDGTTAENNLRRVDEIVDGIIEFVSFNGVAIRDVEFWVEGPMLNPKGASHLFDIGWLYSDLYRRLVLKHGATIHEIQPTTLKKFISGSGASKKDHKDGEKNRCVVCAMEEDFQMVFERDPGKDKLHAYALYRFGKAVADDDLTYTAPARRGSKPKRKKRKTKAIAEPGKRSRGDTAQQRANPRRSKAK